MGSGDTRPEESSRLIEWTGERCVPWVGDLQVVYEHYHRYLLASRFVRGKRVLDLASGEGYGAAILAEHASRVIGIEIDPASVAHSRQTYRRDGLEFVEGSMLDLSQFADATFDVVTCFEALEHVVEHDELVQGVRRVLAPGGLFLTSTPDRLMYSDHLHQHNPYHVRELSLEEFQELLGGYFTSVHVWGQSVALGSLLHSIDPEQRGQSTVVPLVSEGDGWAERPPYTPTYYVAMASDGPLPAVPVQSTLVDPNLTLVRSTQQALHDRDSELESARSDVATLRRLHDAREAEFVRLAERLRELDDEVEQARSALAARDAELARLTGHVGILDQQLESARLHIASLEARRAPDRNGPAG